MWIETKERKPEHEDPVLVKLVEWGCVDYFVAYHYNGKWYSTKAHLEVSGTWDRGTIDDQFQQGDIIAWKEIE